MTPREFSLYCQGQREKEQRDVQNAVTVAFQRECFAREKGLSGKILKKALELFGYKPKPKPANSQTEEFAWAAIRGAYAGKGRTIAVHKGPIWQVNRLVDSISSSVPKPPN